MTPYWSDPWLTVYQGDWLDVLREMPAASVHCVVTSPPYWGLRDYGTPGQLGLEPTPEEYVAKLVAGFREVRRVLRDDGTLWLNLGDSYAANGSGGGGGALGSTLGISDGNPGRGVKQWEPAIRAPKFVPLGLKPKDLVGIPWRVAFALQADGWYLRSEITWCKSNAMPESVTDRPTSATEKLFLFAKSPRYFFDQEAVRESGVTGSEAPLSGVREGPGKASGTTRYARGSSEGQGAGAPVLLHGEGQSSYEAVPVERQGEGEPSEGRPQAPSRNGHREHPDGSRVDGDQGWSASALPLLWEAGALDDGSPHPVVEGRAPQRGERGGGVPELQQREGQSVGRNLRNWWVISSQPYPGAHFATFPRKLVEPCVKAGTSERGVCPECGAPWERETGEAQPTNGRGSGNKTRRVATAGEYGRTNTHMGSAFPWQPTATATTGWRPTCAHDAEPVPATVLDCFAGSGTTGLVAQSLGRRAVLIDLSAEYLVQAMGRNRDIPLGLA